LHLCRIAEVPAEQIQPSCSPASSVLRAGVLVQGFQRRRNAAACPANPAQLQTRRPQLPSAAAPSPAPLGICNRNS
jgi:hypothetical protein